MNISKPNAHGFLDDAHREIVVRHNPGYAAGGTIGNRLCIELFNRWAA